MRPHADAWLAINDTVAYFVFEGQITGLGTADALVLCKANLPPVYGVSNMSTFALNAEGNVLFAIEPEGRCGIVVMIHESQPCGEREPSFGKLEMLVSGAVSRVNRVLQTTGDEISFRLRTWDIEASRRVG